MRYDPNNIYAIHNYCDYLIRENKEPQTVLELVTKALKSSPHNELILSLYAKV